MKQAIILIFFLSLGTADAVSLRGKIRQALAAKSTSASAETCTALLACSTESKCGCATGFCCSTWNEFEGQCTAERTRAARISVSTSLYASECAATPAPAPVAPAASVETCAALAACANDAKCGCATGFCCSTWNEFETLCSAEKTRAARQTVASELFVEGSCASAQAPCEQDAKLAKYHESITKISSVSNDELRWEAAFDACASRGQYLCSSTQNQEQCATAQNYPSSAFLAVGDAGSEGAWINVGPSGDSSTLTTSPGSGDRLFSCCGTVYPGHATQQTTTVIAVNVAEEGDEPQVVFVSESHLIELMNDVTLSASAEAGLETGTSVGCEWDEEGNYFCGAAAEAEIRATLRVEASTTVATVGGVPVVGTIYYEATVGVAAGATAGVTDEGLEVGAAVTFDASVTYGVEFSGEVAPGVEASGGVSTTAGVEATAEAGATVTLSEVSADFEAGVDFGVSVDVEGGVEADEGSISGTAGACAGCAGAGFSPAVGVSGCELTVAAEGSVSVGVGVTVGFEGTVDVCLIGNAIAGAAGHVADWGEDLADDVANGVTDAANVVAAVTVDAANVVATGVVTAANEVADFTVDAANTVADGTVDAANEVADFTVDAANTVADGTVDAANTVADGTVDAANTVADGAEDAAEEVADFISGF